jgi:hypothetical protein
MLRNVTISNLALQAYVRGNRALATLAILISCLVATMVGSTAGATRARLTKPCTFLVQRHGFTWHSHLPVCSFCRDRSCRGLLLGRGRGLRCRPGEQADLSPPLCSVLKLQGWSETEPAAVAVGFGRSVSLSRGSSAPLGVIKASESQRFANRRLR